MRGQYIYFIYHNGEQIPLINYCKKELDKYKIENVYGKILKKIKDENKEDLFLKSFCKEVEQKKEIKRIIDVLLNGKQQKSVIEKRMLMNTKYCIFHNGEKIPLKRYFKQILNDMNIPDSNHEKYYRRFLSEIDKNVFISISDKKEEEFQKREFTRGLEIAINEKNYNYTSSSIKYYFYHNGEHIPLWELCKKLEKKFKIPNLYKKLIKYINKNLFLENYTDEEKQIKEIRRVLKVIKHMEEEKKAQFNYGTMKIKEFCSVLEINEKELLSFYYVAKDMFSIVDGLEKTELIPKAIELYIFTIAWKIYKIENFEYKVREIPGKTFRSLCEDLNLDYYKIVLREFPKIRCEHIGKVNKKTLLFDEFFIVDIYLKKEKINVLELLEKGKIKKPEEKSKELLGVFLNDLFVEKEPKETLKIIM